MRHTAGEKHTPFVEARSYRMTSGSGESFVIGWLDDITVYVGIYIYIYVCVCVFTGEYTGFGCKVRESRINATANATWRLCTCMLAWVPSNSRRRSVV